MEHYNTSSFFVKRKKKKCPLPLFVVAEKQSMRKKCTVAKFRNEEGLRGMKITPLAKSSALSRFLFLLGVSSIHKLRHNNG